MSVFKPGNLVTPATWVVTYVGLCSEVNVAGGPGRIIGRLASRAIAIVVATHRSDCSNVYVFGPDGGGWIPGGMLVIVPS